jgi:hypothetical protein
MVVECFFMRHRWNNPFEKILVTKMKILETKFHTYSFSERIEGLVSVVKDFWSQCYNTNLVLKD